MAKNSKPRSLNEAKSWQHDMPTRIEPSVAPAPRNSTGLKREDPTSIEPFWKRIDEGENVAPHKYTATYAIGNGTSALCEKRRRRRYTDEEKAQVADTRKRGACPKCRTSRTKCLHGPSASPSPAATDQYQMQTESHEIFALGLTTPSLTASKVGHKQVIKETIAAIDDKLVNAQSCLVGKNQLAGKEAGAKVLPLVSPPEHTIQKEVSGQQRPSPAKVHHVKASPAPPTTFQDGVKTFRVFDARKSRQGKMNHQPKASSVVSNQNRLGMKMTNVGKAPNGPQPFGCRKVLAGGIPTSVLEKYDTEHIIKQPVFQRTSDFETPKLIKPGCKIIQASAADEHLKVPYALPFQPKPDWGLSTRTLGSASKDKHTILNYRDSTTSRRPASPMSEGTSSNRHSYVSLPELSLGQSISSDHELSERPVTTSPEHQSEEQPSGSSQDMLEFDIVVFQGSYTDLLNRDISIIALSDSNHTMAASQNDDVSLLNAEPEFVCFSDFMEVD